MIPDRYAVVVHGRWSDDEPPRATVIRSRDGFMWHDMCTTDPDSAEEIAEALTYVSEDRAEAEVERLRAAGDAIADAVSTDDLFSAVAVWEEARRER